MGTREIQSVFSQCRNVARKNNPEGVPLINTLERICLSNYSGKLPVEKARIAIRSALFKYNQNPSMLDLAEAQAKSSKMLSVVPDYIPSTQEKSVVSLINQKANVQKPVKFVNGIFGKVPNYSGKTKSKPAIFMEAKVNQSKAKGLVFKPRIVVGKVNNNKSIFDQFSSKNRIQSKGIFSGVNMKQGKPVKGIFGGMNLSKRNSGGILGNIKTSSGKGNRGIFSGINLKQGRKQGKSIIELMNEGRK